MRMLGYRGKMGDIIMDHGQENGNYQIIGV